MKGVDIRFWSLTRPMGQLRDFWPFMPLSCSWSYLSNYTSSKIVFFFLWSWENCWHCLKKMNYYWLQQRWQPSLWWIHHPLLGSGEAPDEIEIAPDDCQVVHSLHTILGPFKWKCSVWSSNSDYAELVALGAIIGWSAAAFIEAVQFADLLGQTVLLVGLPD